MTGIAPWLSVEEATEIEAVSEEHGWRIGRIADPSGHHWEIGRRLST
jgi:PhnB protein